MLGKTERRLALVILLTATIPLVVAVMLAYSMFSQASSVWLNPDVDQQLERGVSLYGDYVRAVKNDMKHQTDALAADGLLRAAAAQRDPLILELRLEHMFARSPDLVSLAVEDADGEVLARTDRGRPVDEARERKLEVRRPLADGPGGESGGTTLVATFAFDRRYEQELERAGAVRDTYDRLLSDRRSVFLAFYKAFAALLFITMVVTVVLGFILARGVTRRINRLAEAINRMAEGDLSVRVPVTGSDELTELARVFNRMLTEMQQSRARIEYLQRIGAWQEMAQRLAHEIKNPLTPIQLAVQECHRKYTGDDPRYRGLLDTTLEIVEEEVGTLRRLVGNFSSFARLPHAELAESDLREFLRECSEQLTHLALGGAADGIAGDDASFPADGADAEALGAHNVEISWEIPEISLPAAIDKQMLRRVLVNLVRNAVQAIRDLKAAGGHTEGRVTIRACPEAEGTAIIVEDDGPGVPANARERIFDPYFTTKVDGTGLGLAIVKKIVVEHGGSIEVGESTRLGGARFVLHLPDPHSPALVTTHDAEAGRIPPSRPSRRAVA